MKPTTAAVGVTAAGAVGASTLKGMGRLAAGGAAAGAGQLALSWLATQSTPKKTDVPTLPPPKTGRNSSASFDDIESAFARAREQLELEDEAAAYADGYDVIEVDHDLEGSRLWGMTRRYAGSVLDRASCDQPRRCE